MLSQNGSINVIIAFDSVFGRKDYGSSALNVTS
jgi:hypothetical protein